MKKFVLPTLPTWRWILLLSAILGLLSFFNFDSTQMQGLIPNYIDFAHFFRSGFDLNSPFRTGQTTFPMWGYGMILATAWPKWLIILLQQAANLLFLVWLDKQWLALGFSTKARNAFRWLTFFAWPWHLMHAVLWPYSIGAIGISVAVFSLFRFLKDGHWKFAIAAGVAFGITLHFRSDYTIFFLLISSGVAVYSWWTSRRWIGFSIPTIGLFLLLPWMHYTKQRTGHTLLTSTNAGHTFFCGLGQLNNNVWGITPLDEDSTMQAIARPFGGTLSYAGDSVLKKAWKDSVLAHPFEFVRKMGSVAVFRLSPRPFNAGGMMDPVLEQFALPKNPSSYGFRFFLTGLTVVFGFCWFAIGLIAILFWIFRSHKKDWEWLGLGLIAFQIALVLGAIFMPPYHTNIFWFYALFFLHPSVNFSLKNRRTN